MKGPFEFAGYAYLGLGRNDEVFRPGRYRVIRAFDDADCSRHSPGDEWILMFAGFNKFEEEKVLYVSLDGRHQWMIALSWKALGQAEVIENFSLFAEWIGPLPDGFPPAENF